MRIGPSFLIPVEVHDDGEEKVLDIGGMLHKTVQLVGNIQDAVVEIAGSIDPLVKTGEKVDRDRTWMTIAHLTVADPYKHHVGYLRWIRAKVSQSSDRRFGVVIMGED
jgi:hypothetical protein